MNGLNGMPSIIEKSAAKGPLDWGIPAPNADRMSKEQLQQSPAKPRAPCEST